ncbi:unnamed protein product [Allacma fusca]|uniref:Uncharacterized protein n=1 Tax=Allacma fusca TaxID=39272 RepID=A0A8J2KFV5_9HEXA|nr:unnamed protein product [Allacma fusca]
MSIQIVSTEEGRDIRIVEKEPEVMGPVVISASPGTTLVEVLEKVYEQRRDEIVTEDLGITTPLMVLKDMASEYGVGVEMKTFEIHVPQTLPGPNTIIQRVTIRVGHFEVSEVGVRQFEFCLRSRDRSLSRSRVIPDGDPFCCCLMFWADMAFQFEFVPSLRSSRTVVRLSRLLVY